MSTELKYKTNVAAILQKPTGEILICERLNEPGSWQFPQGGAHADETLEEALRREVREEIAVEPTEYRIVSSKGPFYYLFGGGRLHKGYHGKEQYYFLCKVIGSETRIDVGTMQPEFRAFRWIQPAEFEVAWLPEMKHAVYRMVLREFFEVII